MLIEFMFLLVVVSFIITGAAMSHLKPAQQDSDKTGTGCRKKERKEGREKKLFGGGSRGDIWWGRGGCHTKTEAVKWCL